MNSKHQMTANHGGLYKYVLEKGENGCCASIYVLSIYFYIENDNASNKFKTSGEERISLENNNKWTNT